MMLTAIRVELAKVFAKWRTYIGFIALGLLIPVVVVAMGVEGMKYFDFATANLQQMFSFSGNLMNGYTMSYVLLGSLYVHVPFLVTLVAGDILAGEATAGTYRLILTRPVSRFTMVTSKFIAVLIHTNLLVFFLAALSLGLGVLILGPGEVIVIRENITIIATDDALWRFAYGYGFAALAMTTVASIAFFFSSLVENGIGPIMTTMAIIIVFTIIAAIDVPMFDYVRPLFFTSHMIGWKDFFNQPVAWSAALTSAGVLLVHIVACYVGALIVIQRKDILT